MGGCTVIKVCAYDMQCGHRTKLSPKHKPSTIILSNNNSHLREDMQCKDCFGTKQALRYLGKAYHSVSDSYSPAHMGFQIWWDPINGPPHFGDFFAYYFGYVQGHESQENMAAYNRIGGQVPKKVAVQLQGDLVWILSRCNSK